MKITHSQGIWDDTDLTYGNIQNITFANRTFTQTGSTYHYLGKVSQQTGSAFTSGSTSKTIICELETNTHELTVTETTGTTGLLNIVSGVVVNTEAAHITGTGNLTITGGGLKTSVLGSTSTVPMLTGTYSITGGFISLNAAGDQELRGLRAYTDLIFTTSGAKTLTNAIQDIDGTVTIESNAVLDVESFSFGNKDAGNNNRETNLTMTGGTFQSSKVNDEQPMMEGTFNLTGGVVRFYGSTVSQQRIKKFFRIKSNSL